MTNKGKNAHIDSGNVEWGTPMEIVSPIIEWYLRRPFLDPFSSATANEDIGADWYYSIDDDGFAQPWCQPNGNPANLWINHPFGTSLNRMFVNKLELEISLGHVNRFAGICYDAWGTEWFSKLAGLVDCMWHPGPGSPGCTKNGRVAYKNLATGKVQTSPQKSSVVYFGSASGAYTLSAARLAVGDLGGYLFGKPE
jgi:hypothetical protein